MKLAIIIVSYNTAELTCSAIQSCLDDLRNHAALLNETEIVVVDNASTDNSQEKIQQLFSAYIVGTSPRLKLVVRPTNDGFAVANNAGIRETSAANILLLNSDTLIETGALRTLVDTMESTPRNEATAVFGRSQGTLDRLGILSAALQNVDGTPQAQGGSFPTLLSLAAHWLFLDDIPLIGKFFPATQHTGKNLRQYSQADGDVVQLDWVGGTAMLVRREVFEEVGMLDESIFMYGEDIEFCMRAKDHHWDIGVCPSAKITHYGSASSHSSRAILGEIHGYLFIWGKHKPVWQYSHAKRILRLGCWLRYQFYKMVKMDPKTAAVYTQALQDVLR